MKLYRKIKIGKESTKAAFLSWDRVAELFSIKDSILTDRKNPPKDVIETAAEETEQWSLDFRRRTGKEVSEERKLEVENLILDSIFNHWSAYSIMKDHLDLKKMAKNINILSSTKPDLDLFETEPPLGDSLFYYTNECGIFFTIKPPFVIPYVLLNIKHHEYYPITDISKITSLDIVETLIMSRPSNAEIDISGWDYKRTSIKEKL